MTQFNGTFREFVLQHDLLESMLLRFLYRPDESTLALALRHARRPEQFPAKPLDATIPLSVPPFYNYLFVFEGIDDFCTQLGTRVQYARLGDTEPTEKWRDHDEYLSGTTITAFNLSDSPERRVSMYFASFGRHSWCYSGVRVFARAIQYVGKSMYTDVQTGLEIACMNPFPEIDSQLP